MLPIYYWYNKVVRTSVRMPIDPMIYMGRFSDASRTLVTATIRSQVILS
jgi:hypothetical protein